MAKQFYAIMQCEAGKLLPNAFVTIDEARQFLRDACRQGDKIVSILSPRDGDVFFDVQSTRRVDYDENDCTYTVQLIGRWPNGERISYFLTFTSLELA